MRTVGSCLTPEEILDRAMRTAQRLFSRNSNRQFPSLGKEADNLAVIAKNAQTAKAALAVVLTGLLYKAVHPEQDVRYHQEQMRSADGLRIGYSGRGFDSKWVTPCLRKHDLPFMVSGTGWLTRSFEQPFPYIVGYKGSVSPKDNKKAFLSLYDAMQSGRIEKPYSAIVALFFYILVARQNWKIPMLKPCHKTIREISSLLTKHFAMRKASRLPVIAVYAAYKVLVDEVRRYKDTSLLSLLSHQASDSKSGAIGDIQVNNGNGHPFEGIEIKHNIAIDLEIVEDVFDKIKSTGVKRYYILSNIETPTAERKLIDDFVDKVRRDMGCQIIVNGLLTTIEYYMRLMDDVDLFVSAYCDLCDTDSSVMSHLKDGWNSLFSTDVGDDEGFSDDDLEAAA